MSTNHQRPRSTGTNGVSLASFTSKRLLSSGSDTTLEQQIANTLLANKCNLLLAIVSQSDCVGETASSLSKDIISMVKREKGRSATELFLKRLLRLKADSMIRKGVNLSEIIRYNSMSTMMVNAFAKIEGFSYLTQTLSKPIKEIRCHLSQCEIDPQKLPVENRDAILQDNMERLTLCVTTLLKSVTENKDAMPASFHRICHFLCSYTDNPPNRSRATSSVYSCSRRSVISQESNSGGSGIGHKQSLDRAEGGKFAASSSLPGSRTGSMRIKHHAGGKERESFFGVFGHSKDHQHHQYHQHKHHASTSGIMSATEVAEKSGLNHKKHHSAFFGHEKTAENNNSNNSEDSAVAGLKPRTRSASSSKAEQAAATKQSNGANGVRSRSGTNTDPNMSLGLNPPLSAKQSHVSSTSLASARSGDNGRGSTSAGSVGGDSTKLFKIFQGWRKSNKPSPPVKSKEGSIENLKALDDGEAGLHSTTTRVPLSGNSEDINNSPAFERAHSTLSTATLRASKPYLLTEPSIVLATDPEVSSRLCDSPQQSEMIAHIPSQPEEEENTSKTTGSDIENAAIPPLSAIPPKLQRASHIMSRMSASSSGTNTRSVGSLSIGEKVVGSFLFLWFFVPAIASPDLNGLVETRISSQTRRGLVLAGKILMALCNDIEFGEKEEYLMPMNAFLRDNRVAMKDFLDFAAMEVEELDLIDSETKETSYPLLSNRKDHSFEGTALNVKKQSKLYSSMPSLVQAASSEAVPLKEIKPNSTLSNSALTTSSSSSGSRGDGIQSEPGKLFAFIGKSLPSVEKGIEVRLAELKEGESEGLVLNFCEMKRLIEGSRYDPAETSHSGSSGNLKGGLDLVAKFGKLNKSLVNIFHHSRSKSRSSDDLASSSAATLVSLGK